MKIRIEGNVTHFDDADFGLRSIERKVVGSGVLFGISTRADLDSDGWVGGAAYVRADQNRPNDCELYFYQEG